LTVLQYGQEQPAFAHSFSSDYLPSTSSTETPQLIHGDFGASMGTAHEPGRPPQQGAGCVLGSTVSRELSSPSFTYTSGARNGHRLL